MSKPNTQWRLPWSASPLRGNKQALPPKSRDDLTVALSGDSSCINTTEAGCRYALRVPHRCLQRIAGGRLRQHDSIERVEEFSPDIERGALLDSEYASEAELLRRTPLMSVV